MKIELLCTLGPQSLNDKVLNRFEKTGVSLFRINLSHTKTEDIENIVSYIRSQTKVPICLDTEGAQIRTGTFLEESILLTENDNVNIPNYFIEGDKDSFNFYPYKIIDRFLIGDMISVDFNSVLVQVIDKASDNVIVKVLSGGLVGRNKAVNLYRDLKLPIITAKDKLALVLGRKLKIKHYALSFTSCADDITYIRELTGEGAFIISKIETINGMDNIEEIASVSDALLLDRGDISRQVPIEQIPRLQKDFTSRGKKSKVKIYVATNLLESMITQPTPTRAEVNDVYNALCDGVNGLVLAAETAIGKYPIQCTEMIAKMINQYESALTDKNDIINYKQVAHYSLVDPHGGHIVDQVLTTFDEIEVDKYKKLVVSDNVLSDVEQIALGTFSPLQGFLNKKDLDSVLNNYCLQNGIVWPLPILCQISESQASNLVVGDKLALISEKNNETYAIMNLEEIYGYDLESLADKMFGTNDIKHPGVNRLIDAGSYFLAGKIYLLKRLPSSNKYYELTPSQVRIIFESKGWSRIVGFHTRNVIHNAHEYIQLEAYKRAHCDGIFIHPIIGFKKSGDFSANIIIKCYEQMIKEFYAKGKVLFATFQNYSRYCGPREAVFTALCRKNFGCSHFIVGRDHTGVGSFYEPDSARKLFNELGDIGITPVYFDQVYYCEECENYIETCVHADTSKKHISGTQVRKILREGGLPPEWFIRKEIAQTVLNEIVQKNDVFVK